MKTRGMSTLQVISNLSALILNPRLIIDVTMVNSRMHENTNKMHISIQMSSIDMQETLGTFCLTAPNMAVSVSRVVMPIPTRPENRERRNVWLPSSPSFTVFQNFSCIQYFPNMSVPCNNSIKHTWFSLEKKEGQNSSSITFSNHKGSFTQTCETHFLLCFPKLK